MAKASEIKKGDTLWFPDKYGDGFKSTTVVKVTPKRLYVDKDVGYTITFGSMKNLYIEKYRGHHNREQEFSTSEAEAVRKEMEGQDRQIAQVQRNLDSHLEYRERLAARLDALISEAPEEREESPEAADDEEASTEPHPIKIRKEAQGA